MANAHHLFFQLLLITLLCAALIVQGYSLEMELPNNTTSYHISSTKRELNFKNKTRRVLIGSVAPTCSFNECRGCKHKCRAVQVPIEGNDPSNSAYYYKCVCHRPV